MCLAVGHPVKRLKRSRFGPLHLNRLPKGTCRVLTKREVDALRVEAGLSNEEKRKTKNENRHERAK